MSWLLGLGTPLGRLGVIGSIILALVGMRACDINKQRAIGEERHAAKVEKATDEAVSKAARAGDKSLAGGGWGVQLNPHYRN